MPIDSFRGKYTFLSNFHPAPVLLDGMEYPAVEQAYQAAKSEDMEVRRAMRTATPGESKRLGKVIKIRSGWDTIKLSVMEDLVRQKFEHPQLIPLLLETGVEPLIEGNNWGDTFWGVCDGVGENHLGKLLMRIRTELRVTAPKWCGGCKKPLKQVLYTDPLMCGLCRAPLGIFGGDAYAHVLWEKPVKGR